MATKKKTTRKKQIGKRPAHNADRKRPKPKAIPYDSPEATDHLRKKLGWLWAQWCAVAEAKPRDERARAMANVLDALREGDWLFDAEKSAVRFLRERKAPDLPGQLLSRPEAAEWMRSWVQGCLEHNGAAHLATHFIAMLQKHAKLVDMTTLPLGSWGSDERANAVAIVQREFNRAMRRGAKAGPIDPQSVDPERLVIAGLRALGAPDNKANGLFKFEDKRR